MHNTQTFRVKYMYMERTPNRTKRMKKEKQLLSYGFE